MFKSNRDSNQNSIFQQLKERYQKFLLAQALMSPQPSYLKLTQTLIPIFVGKHFGEHESEILSHTYVFSYLCIAPAGSLGMRKRCWIESRLNVAYVCCVQENKWGIGLIEKRIMLNVHVAKNLGSRPFNI